MLLGFQMLWLGVPWCGVMLWMRLMPWTMWFRLGRIVKTGLGLMQRVLLRNFPRFRLRFRRCIGPWVFCLDFPNVGLWLVPRLLWSWLLPRCRRFCLRLVPGSWLLLLPWILLPWILLLGLMPVPRSFLLLFTWLTEVLWPVFWVFWLHPRIALVHGPLAFLLLNPRIGLRSSPLIFVFLFPSIAPRVSLHPRVSLWFGPGCFLLWLVPWSSLLLDPIVRRLAKRARARGRPRLVAQRLRCPRLRQVIWWGGTTQRRYRVLDLLAPSFRL